VTVQQDGWSGFAAEQKAHDVTGFIAEDLVVAQLTHFPLDQTGYGGLAEAGAGRADQLPGKADQGLVQSGVSVPQDPVHCAVSFLRFSSPGTARGHTGLSQELCQWFLSM